MTPICLPLCLQMFPSDDPLEAPDFDTVQYINSLFPNEQVRLRLENPLEALHPAATLRLPLWEVCCDNGKGCGCSLSIPGSVPHLWEACCYYGEGCVDAV
jgi:hypothetical protein